MLLHKAVIHDSRVRREAKALAADGHDVTVAHLAPSEVPTAVMEEGYRVVSVLPPRLGRRRLPFALHRLVFMRRFVGAIRALRPDVVHAHDAAMLAPGWAGARLAGARLVYDSHELATGVAYRGRAWARLVWALERLFVRRADAVITVSDGIAERLQELYGLTERPAVVRNACDLPASNGAVDLRRRLAIEPSAPLVLHQGAAATGRGCETLVRAMAHVPGAHLVFLGDGDPGYEELLTDVAIKARVSERVHFLRSVPLEELLAYTRGADLGVAGLEGNCENHRLALPNKVFEYAAAGIPVVVSDLPEMSRLIADTGAGRAVAWTDPVTVGEGIGAAIASPPEKATLDSARETLAWRTERERLVALYRTLSSG